MYASYASFLISSSNAIKVSAILSLVTLYTPSRTNIVSEMLSGRVLQPFSTICIAPFGYLRPIHDCFLCICSIYKNLETKSTMFRNIIGCAFKILSVLATYNIVCCIWIDTSLRPFDNKLVICF